MRCLCSGVHGAKDHPLTMQPLGIVPRGSLAQGGNSFPALMYIVYFFMFSSVDAGMESYANWVQLEEEGWGLDLAVECVTPVGTGLVWDERMTEFRCTWDESFPECPERLTAIREKLLHCNLLERCTLMAVRGCGPD
uniref:Uncharacterized protein n=1 Tax=Varanus komodoensis TaxID=61221 RepID=A0A8D2IQV2_VARKO